MSESFYRRLSRTHELLDEDNLAEALDLMDRLRPDRLSDYEAAQLYQTYGFVYSQLEREEEAFEAFGKCLELDALPTMVQQGIVYSVAGYYSGSGTLRGIQQHSAALVPLRSRTAIRGLHTDGRQLRPAGNDAGRLAIRDSRQ